MAILKWLVLLQCSWGVYTIVKRMPILGSNLSNMKNLALIVLAAVSLSGTLHAQVYTNKPVGEKQEALIDSLKSTPYPYALPIWGDKAAALGFDLP